MLVRYALSFFLTWLQSKFFGRSRATGIFSEQLPGHAEARR